MIGKFILVHRLCPGDETAATAVLRDLKLRYGDQIAIDFRNYNEPLRRHNPYLTPLDDNDPQAKTVRLNYQPGIHSAGRGNRHHFLTWFHRDFTEKTGIPVDCLYSKPDLYLDEEKRVLRPVSGRYWLVIAGGKTDYTVKHWDYLRFQEVVDRLWPCGIRFVQTGLRKTGKPAHVQPKLERVLDLVNWGGIEELLWLIWHADGVLCPVTAAMHMAAAFEKPCVVVAGGREEWWWEAYTNDGQFGSEAQPIRVPHRYLHTLGLLECCRQKGCWLHKVVRIDSDTRLCRLPAARKPIEQPLPQCMEMITADHVMDAILSYYHEQYLAPPDVPAAEVRSWQQEHPPQPDPRWEGCRPVAASVTVASPPQDLSRLPLPVLIDKNTRWYTGPQTPVPIFPAPEKSSPPVFVVEPIHYRVPEPAAAPSYSKLTPAQKAALGERITLCLFLKGSETELHRRCLDLWSKGLQCLENRVVVAISGEVPAGSIEFARQLGFEVVSGPGLWPKYQALRHVIHEYKRIETTFTIWSDDDCWPISPYWLNALADTILRQTEMVGCFGRLMYHVLQFNRRSDPRLWFSQASWYRHRPWRLRSGRPAPNGDTIHYASGRFCVFRTCCLYDIGIPDSRVLHWGGDIVAGEQLYQHNWKIAPFDDEGKMVFVGPEDFRRQRDKDRPNWMPWY